MNRTNTVTPYGNSTYSQTGTNADGSPEYTQTISLTPEVQQQLEAQNDQNLALGQLGATEVGRAADTVSQPLPDTAASGTAASDALYAKNTAYLDPQFAEGQSELDSKLANEGIVQGSEAYNRAEDDFGRQKAQAYGTARDDAIAGGQTAQAQALANALTIRNQPFNELASIRSGSAIQNPTFGATYTGGNAQSGDIQGNVYKTYADQVASSNSFLNGLFGLGSSYLSTLGTGG